MFLKEHKDQNHIWSIIKRPNLGVAIYAISVNKLISIGQKDQICDIEKIRRPNVLTKSQGPKLHMVNSRWGQRGQSTIKPKQNAPNLHH